MLFRFREAQAADAGIIDAGRSRRPRAITEVMEVNACERWRGQVLREISRKVARIQDSTLSDFQVRDLNDEINKLLREKNAWEVQIKNLGGPNYLAARGRIFAESGEEISHLSGKGYKYFGRARELPGVKEMFEAAAQRRAEEEKERKGGTTDEAARLARRPVDAAYYGFAPDYEDDALLAYERAKEQEAAENMARTGPQEPPDGWEPLPGDGGDGRGWVLPTIEEVQQELVERRKRRLLDQLT